MFFVNLNLRVAHRTPAVLEEFLGRGVNPELGLDARLMDLVDLDWHRDLASMLEARGLTASLHLPFIDLQPGSADALVRAACLTRLRRAVEVAQIYRPAHLIGHVRFDPLMYLKSYGPWRERAADTWLAALSPWPDHPPLYLENTFEPDPSSVAGMVETLREALGGRVGLCLDVGHWHAFSDGCRLRDLDRWLDAFAPFLAHLHLHDNDGGSDQHLGLGQGSIPWEEFFQGLARRGLTPTATFEPHTPDAYRASMEFARRRPDLFESLGVVPPA